MEITHDTRLASSGSVADSGRFKIDYPLFLIAVVILLAVYTGYRMYQQANGMSVGLDSTDPAFEATWMRLFYIQLPLLFGLVAAVQIYLIATRERDIDNVPPAVELRRYFGLTMWLVLYTFTFYWTGSFFGEGDGNWHQTVLRDTPLTPSHIVLFYACIPIYLFFGIGSFVYAMTRIPAFCRGISVMHAFGVVGPFLILPNLGYNEWGHAYWLTEEIFSHPLHWGFAVLGWNGLALVGVLMQMIPRMCELLLVVFKSEATA